MRVYQNDNLTRRVSALINDLIGGKTSAPKSRSISSSKRIKGAKFSTWSMPAGRQISSLAGLNRPPKIKVDILKQFVSNRKKIDERYPDFIANVFLNNTVSEKSYDHANEIAAIQRMVGLIKDSIEDIQAISLLNISYSKG